MDRVGRLFRAIGLLLTGQQTFFLTFWVVYLPVNLLCSLVAELTEEFGQFLPQRLSETLPAMTLAIGLANVYVMGVAVIWCAYRNRPLDNWQWFGSFGAAMGMLLLPMLLILSSFD